MSFSVIVDKDYFMPYLNDERKTSLDPRGFPKYRKELKADSLLDAFLPDPANQEELLEKFHSNHSRAMEILDAVGVYCFRWAMEVDLVASNTAEALIYNQLDVPLADRTTLELLSNRGKSIKRLETVLSVLRQLPKRNYPHSYARIRTSLPKVIKQAN